MKAKPQVIFDQGKPAFVVLRYEDYLTLAGGELECLPDDAELVPFVLTDYISNAIRVARIEAGFNQQQLAKLLGVTQGYVSRIESRGFKVTDELLERVRSAIAKRRNRKQTSPTRRNKKVS